MIFNKILHFLSIKTKSKNKKISKHFCSVVSAAGRSKVFLTFSNVIEKKKTKRGVEDMEFPELLKK